MHSVAGLLPPGAGLLVDRPFRAPHHTISNAALVGGGSQPRPGEVSLAHHGVLFLDEMLEFSRHVLEVLRQPLEEGRVTDRARRADGGLSRPLHAGRRDEPVSLRLSRRHRARVPLHAASRSRAIAIACRVRCAIGWISPSKCRRFRPTRSGSVEPARVVRRRPRARGRGARSPERALRSRSASGPTRSSRARLMPAHCPAESAPASACCRTAVSRLGLSARGYDRVRKVARTIADLAGHDEIGADEVAEALQFRMIVR